MSDNELIPHLFRTEYSKIVAVLCTHFGLDHIETAQDIASDTFLAALNTWTYAGIPENPTGWLYAVAKNKTKNLLARSHTFATISSEMKALSDEKAMEMTIDLSDKNISDSQLQMLFAVCHPILPAESQVGLALRILCGFGIDEIANAFLTTKETINKRLHRAKDKLRSEKITLEFPGKAELLHRLDSVLITLYLLFNEGYYSETNDAVIREELSYEAMRLTHLLIENEETDLPKVNALLALMCFHASRFPARKDNSGSVVLYDDQDATLWDQRLISRGAEFLHKASIGESISRYHLEANIAYWHTRKDEAHKWSNILQLYNHLLVFQYSPIAALNRTYALAKVLGPETALREAEKLDLHDNPYYYTLLGELQRESNLPQAMKNFQKALQLAKTKTEKQTIQAKLDRL